MIKFSKEKILLLHGLIAQETGGSVGIRDEALLESALDSDVERAAVEAATELALASSDAALSPLAPHPASDAASTHAMHVPQTFFDVFDNTTVPPSHRGTTILTPNPESTLKPIAHKHADPPCDLGEWGFARVVV